MKKTITFISAALLGLSVLFSTGLSAFANGYSCDDGAISFSVHEAGDADGNGEVDIRDRVRMKRHISDADIEIDPAADINIDGDINAEDLSELRIMLLNMYAVIFSPAAKAGEKAWNF